MSHEGFPISGWEGRHLRGLRVELLFVEDGEIAFDHIPQMNIVGHRVSSLDPECSPSNLYRMAIGYVTPAQAGVQFQPLDSRLAVPRLRRSLAALRRGGNDELRKTIAKAFSAYLVCLNYNGSPISTTCPSGS